MVYTFTEEELSKYDGVKNEKIYFSVRGKVYDVTEAKEFYGPGEPSLCSACPNQNRHQAPGCVLNLFL